MKPSARINVVSLLMAYSAALSWILLYYCMYDYLWDKAGRRLRGGIGAGMMIHWLANLIIALPIVITVLNRKRAKIIVMAVYLVYSSCRLLPEYPFRWLYFSVGTTVFFYVMDNLTTFWKMKNSLNEIVVNYVLAILMCVFLIVIEFIFWDEMLKKFLLQRVVLGNVIIAAASLAFYVARDKIHARRGAKGEGK